MNTITAKKIVAMGFTGKRVGEILKLSKDWTQECINNFLDTGEIPTRESIRMVPGTVWHWLCNHQCLKGFRNSSNSERLRWIQDKSIVINGECPEPNDLICFFFPLRSLVFFPSSEHKVTII